ncbi:MAG: four-helix bundle copper-binding protein [Candidatus Protochlamydia sp.]|nr:four-helix bundle copper-binding protein [Candidatus Protochlamydia sp.]
MVNYQNQGNNGKNTAFPQTDTNHMHTLMECMSICAACAKKCIEEGHKRSAALCAECSDVCALAIKSASCQSEFNHQIMDLCAQICDRCAVECQKMQVRHCQECAVSCKKCSEACSTIHSMI